jgi:hypothetical protein
MILMKAPAVFPIVFLQHIMIPYCEMLQFIALLHIVIKSNIFVNDSYSVC